MSPLGHKKPPEDPADKRHRQLMGARLRQARHAAGLTQKDLEARSGIAVRMIHAYETGHSEPMGRALRKLARALGVSVDWLLGLTPTPTPLLTLEEQELLVLFKGFSQSEIEAIFRIAQAFKSPGPRNDKP